MILEAMAIAKMVGWVVAGAVALGFLAKFWDDIKIWLNNVAADAVERALGYKARERMHKAVAVVDRVINTVRNTTTIFTKRNNSDTFFDKTTVIAEAEAYEIDADILKEIAKKNKLVQDFSYKG